MRGAHSLINSRASSLLNRIPLASSTKSYDIGVLCVGEGQAWGRFECRAAPEKLPGK